MNRLGSLEKGGVGTLERWSPGRPGTHYDSVYSDWPLWRSLRILCLQGNRSLGKKAVKGDISDGFNWASTYERLRTEFWASVLKQPSLFHKTLNSSIWGIWDKTALGAYTQPAVICYASLPSKEASVLIALGCWASRFPSNGVFLPASVCFHLLFPLTSLPTLVALQCSLCFPWIFLSTLDVWLTFPLKIPGT